MSTPDKQGQRVRVGLTGLACVFLLVMLAAVFLRATGAEGGHNAAAPVSNVAEAPNEPLATLGVAPGTPAPTPAPPSTSPGSHRTSAPTR